VLGWAKRYAEAGSYAGADQSFHIEVTVRNWFVLKLYYSERLCSGRREVFITGVAFPGITGKIVHDLNRTTMVLENQK